MRTGGKPMQPVEIGYEPKGRKFIYLHCQYKDGLGQLGDMKFF